MFLSLLFTQKLEPKIQLSLDLIECRSRNQDAPGFGQSFQSRRDIHAVAIDVLPFDNHIAKVDANAEFELFFLRQFGVALRHRPLDFDGATDRVDHAGEFYQRAIAHELHDAPLWSGNLRIDQILAGALEARQCIRSFSLHKAAVANDVGGENRRKPPLQCFTPDVGHRSHHDRRVSLRSLALFRSAPCQICTLSNRLLVAVTI